MSLEVKVTGSLTMSAKMDGMSSIEAMANCLRLYGLNDCIRRDVNDLELCTSLNHAGFLRDLVRRDAHCRKPRIPEVGLASGIMLRLGIG